MMNNPILYVDPFGDSTIYYNASGSELYRTTDPRKIFISHASPTDNYFTAWLASKLKLLGYRVWVELDELKSGDAFWPEIEGAIRNQSCKFLVVMSKSYLDKVNNPVSGVLRNYLAQTGSKI